MDSDELDELDELGSDEPDELELLEEYFFLLLQLSKFLFEEGREGDWPRMMKKQEQIKFWSQNI